MTKERLEFRIDRDQAEIIKEVAEAEGRSVSEVIRVLVREGMVRLFDDPKEKLDKINREIEKTEDNLQSLKNRRDSLQDSIIEKGISQS